MSISNVDAALALTDGGRGLPLVLAHGFPLDRRMWEGQVGELAGRNRVIAVDLRGFGQSRSEEAFSIAGLAEDLRGTLKQIDALPCVLAGLSMGGYVALAYVRAYPGDLLGLMLVDTKAEGDSPEQKEGRGKMIELVRKQGAKAVADQMLPRLVAEDTPRTRPAVAAAVRRMAEACPAKTIEHALLAMRDRPDQRASLSSIGVPTLVIVGDGDAITPVAMAETMRRAIPKAELAVIKGSGHMAPMEQPVQVNWVMGRFMGRVG